jgi:excisionase family DNA binding protein
MNPLTLFQEDFEDQLELLRQLPKLSKDTKRAVIDDLLETYVAARVRNPSRTKVERKKTAPASEPKPVPESPYMDFDEACAYLRLTERQLKDLCRDQRITHARIDYRTFRFKRSDLDTWFEAYKLQRKSVYD